MKKAASDEQVYLSTAQAARRLGVSQETVRNLCRDGALPGAFQDPRTRRWQIPAASVEALAPRPAGASAELPGTPFWRRVVAIGAIVAILAGIAGFMADSLGVVERLATATPPPTATAPPTATPLPFAPATEDEVLIVIAAFHLAQGMEDAEPHNEIQRAIRAAADELGFAHLRVAVEPACLAADDRAGAEALGRRYQASMVIWGSESKVRVTVNYLNLKQPDFDAAEVRIEETERTHAMVYTNPEPYSRFITQDLPGQLTFLALFAVGQSYYTEEAYTDSLKAIEKAVASLVPEAKPPEGLAEAYFRLGWLYQVPLGNAERAIANYDQAIYFKSDYTLAYINRGSARAKQDDLTGAMADFDRAIALDPNFAGTYYGRGNVRTEQGDPAGAMADYERAIALDPDHAAAYVNRGIVLYHQGDLLSAQADFERAIALDPNLAAAYIDRGYVHREMGNAEAALADFRRYLELRPDAGNRAQVEAWIAELEAQLGGE